jgi:ATP-dependent Zn protease
MDGFEKTENILIIGATNHEDALDPAAVRPGRFDKKIHVPLPDINGRTDIFEFYLNQIKRTDDIEPKKLAQMTPGFSGAEIENLVNTAITEAVHRGKDRADLSDFEYARDRIMMGIERKKLSIGPHVLQDQVQVVDAKTDKIYGDYIEFLDLKGEYGSSESLAVLGV